jgi:UDP-GlcNAc3NAcA epimerase
MKLLSVVGARPQFIKLKTISEELLNHPHEHYIIHTGQHYDFNMSRIFFEGLNIPEPNVNLNVGSGSHALQTGNILIKIEKEILRINPDCLLVYGDTNSTLAATLAASKIGIPVAHIEAGLRSFNLDMPEEVNRILTDHASSFLFAPTHNALHNLQREGLTKKTFLVGDVMADLIQNLSPQINLIPNPGQVLTNETYLVVTIHRASNTDNFEQLSRIIESINNLSQKVLIIAHPRLKSALSTFNIKIKGNNIKFLEPVGYIEMIRILKYSQAVITDSGGLQKEAFLLGIPCVTIRTETEWIETLHNDMNVLDPLAKNLVKLCDRKISSERSNIFGSGNAAKKIIEILESSLNGENT